MHVEGTVNSLEKLNVLLSPASPRGDDVMASRLYLKPGAQFPQES